jgi:hypothetical protein
MSPTTKPLKDQVFKEPMVVFPLKQYESLMDYIEEMEDRLAIKEREDEPAVSQEEVEKRFMEKFGRKRNIQLFIKNLRRMNC